ncbi:MAG: hydroxymethylglutaryl-CoA lyase [Actinomycetota bacterium]|nr:hydroxymethylglutaryl-CoA lyase [Actinomycetota bacterium]
MSVTLCDVGPRDGLQNEPDVLEPTVRAELCNRLAAAGLPRVEAVSFVREDRVPQMGGAEDVAAALDGPAEWSALVLNERGYDRLAATRLHRVNCTLAVTESFSRRNANASVEEALAAVLAIVERSERPVTVTLSCAFGCPFEGEVDPGAVAGLCERLDAADELVLADTIGVATPGRVKALLGRLGHPRLGFHGHDTRHTGVACAWAAVEAGAEVLDASVGGLGGCPFAPRATGNVATEDLVYLLGREGIETGVDLDVLNGVAEWIAGTLGRDLPGRVYRAGSFPGPTR